MLVARIVFGSFWVSIILFFLLGTVKGNYAPLFAVAFIYLFCYSVQAVLLFVSDKLIEGRTLLFYPVSCLITLLSMPLFIAWLSGNGVGETAWGIFFSRKDGLALADPYVVGSILSYSYLIYKKKAHVEV